jgi:hypothetical protein
VVRVTSPPGSPRDSQAHGNKRLASQLVELLDGPLAHRSEFCLRRGGVFVLHGRCSLLWPLLPISGLTPKAKLRSSKTLQLLTGLAGAKREPRSERRYSEQRSGSRVISSDGKARLRAQCHQRIVGRQSQVGGLGRRTTRGRIPSDLRYRRAGIMRLAPLLSLSARAELGRLDVRAGYFEVALDVAHGQGGHRDGC